MSEYSPVSETELRKVTSTDQLDKDLAADVNEVNQGRRAMGMKPFAFRSLSAELRQRLTGEQ